MTALDFSTTLWVDQTPHQVFNAVNNVRGWWSEQVEGSTQNLNDEFIYHYKNVHYCKIRLTQVVPDQKIVWSVIENFFNFTQDKSEWTGTEIRFEIFKKDNQTALRFTHVGLTPVQECFEVCQDAWTNYIQNSLRNLITTGKGEPNPKDGDGFNAEIVKKWKLNGK
jgi:hypothetical protein